MERTNSSRSSEFVAVLAVAVLLLSAVAVPVAAVSVAEEDVPSDSEVGTQVSATITLNELYQNPQLEQWRLSGETDLQNVTWTMVYYDQTGAKVSQESVDGQNVTGSQISADDGVSEVEVTVTGTVPAVEEYTYDPEEEFLFAALSQTREGGSSNAIDSWATHHYTADSREAREAIDSAGSALEDVSNEDAQGDYESAVDAYEAGNFDNAITLAERAEEKANSAEQSQQTTQLILMGVGGLLVVGLLVGGVLYWRSQQDSYDKLG
jgi:hypothetical protein